MQQILGREIGSERFWDGLLCALIGAVPMLIAGIALAYAKLTVFYRWIDFAILGLGIVWILGAVAVWRGNRVGYLLATSACLLYAVLAAVARAAGPEYLLQCLPGLLAAAYFYSRYRREKGVVSR